jgi:hypothetical protein
LPRWAATLFALVGAWLFAYELHTVIDQAFGAHSIFDKRVHLGVLLCASGLVLARAITRNGEQVAWLLIGCEMPPILEFPVTDETSTLAFMLIS